MITQHSVDLMKDVYKKYDGTFEHIPTTYFSDTGIKHW